MKKSWGEVTLFVIPCNTPLGPTQCILTSLSNRMADEKIGVFHLLEAQPGCVLYRLYELHYLCHCRGEWVWMRLTFGATLHCLLFVFALSSEVKRTSLNCNKKTWLNQWFHMKRSWDTQNSPSDLYLLSSPLTETSGQCSSCSTITASAAKVAQLHFEHVLYPCKLGHSPLFVLELYGNER